MSLDDSNPDEQLTRAKYRTLKQVIAITGTKAPIISDPLNGSMYGSAAFGANMLYPIYNPMVEGNGAVFRQVEQAFSSGNTNTMLATVCSLEPDQPKYFLTMGPQAPSLQMFTFRQQYDPFHNVDLIDGYVGSRALVPVQTFDHAGSDGRQWTLYSVSCSH